MRNLLILALAGFCGLAIAQSSSEKDAAAKTSKGFGGLLQGMGQEIGKATGSAKGGKKDAKKEEKKDPAK